MKTYNWKYIRTEKGKVTYALCVGDEMMREFTDFSLAYHREKDSKDEFQNSLEDYLDSWNKIRDLKPETRELMHLPQVKESIVDSVSFRALQRKIKKKKEEKKR